MFQVIAWALAAAAGPAPLSPSSKWMVDYGKDKCQASRTFGTPQATVFFAIQPPITLGSGQQTLYIAAPNRAGGGVRSGRVTLTLTPSGATRVFDYVSWTSKAGGIREYELVVDKAFVTAFGEASVISLSAGKDALALSTGAMKPVIDALNTCSDDLFKGWGVDPTAQAVTLHGESPGTWFPKNSYPVDARRRGATGHTVIVLTVSPQGRATACRAVVAADPSLDATTCELSLRNARFEPTTTPGDRYSVLSVRWEIWK